MKNLNRFNLMFLITLGLAQSSHAGLVAVHFIQNLDSKDLTPTEAILHEKGYATVDGVLFSKSDRAIVITQQIPDEFEPGFIEIEIVKKSKNQEIPKSILAIKKETTHIEDALKDLPNAGDLDRAVAEFEAIKPLDSRIEFAAQSE